MKAMIWPDDSGAPPHSGNVLAGAIDEFLEHLDVIAFVGHLVEEIPKHRSCVRQFARAVDHAPNQHELELLRDLERVRSDPPPNVDPPLQRLFGVPVHGRQGNGIRIKQPTRIILFHDVFRCTQSMSA
jgi:hypothetical protein